jgi:hypothetical protein
VCPDATICLRMKNVPAQGSPRSRREPIKGVATSEFGPKRKCRTVKRMSQIGLELAPLSLRRMTRSPASASEKPRPRR